MEEIRNDLNKKARIKCGLEKDTYDVRDTKKHPGLEYVYDPKFKTIKDLKDFMILNLKH